MLLLTAAAVLLGRYMARLFFNDRPPAITRALETPVHRLLGVDPKAEETWRGYARDLLLFNGIGVAFLFVLLLLQGFLPLNPAGVPGFAPDLALNTAVSFVTNTNWQAYSGEAAASYLSQMAGFTVQNFLSAATGLAVTVVLIRGLTRRETDRVGCFWVDLTRAVIGVLLPLAIVAALLLASQGVIQNLDPYVQTGDGLQTIAMGPVASQEAIKELGTNGGGFFNANAAHPFENPTPFTNFLEVFMLLLIPAAIPFMFGEAVGDRRQGYILFAVMLALFLGTFTVLYTAELGGNPLLPGTSGIPMEGKEVRFGLAGTALFSTATTATSCGAVDAMHDSLTPLGGLVPLALILLGEVVFGGVGSGFYTLIAFVIIAVFIAGLMIGRTPEYLGKKIGAFEMEMAVVAVLTAGILVLVLSGIALALPAGTSSILNPGPHGLSEIVYAFASMANNNGSAFAGLNAASLFYTLTGSLAMVIGRFVPIVAVLALAGGLAAKKTVPPSFGTLPTHTVPFAVWLVLVILIVGALTFFPIFAMGPIAEHLQMVGGI
ncbi:potassium-transporting ATPase subunit KdpA [Methanosphaerula subterraneus]|uniref:potassium-transporting ATPase subunit KdpA n=1 Tax=Methanosphaerula subterraneus TaxID=3350244 RepID=UPI003F87DA4A